MWCNEYNFNYVRREVDTSEGKSPMQLKDRENGSKVGTFRTIVTQHMSQTCRISVSIETLEISNCAWINQKQTKKLLFYLFDLVVVPYSHLLHWLDGRSPPPLAPKSVFPWCRIIWSWLGGGCWLLGGGRGSSSVHHLQHPPSVPHQMQVLTIVWIVRNFKVERQCVVVNLVQ